MLNVEYGQRWRKRQEPDSASWEVVSVSTIGIGLSGPGPCRMYQTVTLDELAQQWARIS